VEIKIEVTFNCFRDLRILPLCFMVWYLAQHREKLKSSVPVKMQITINIYIHLILTTLYKSLISTSHNIIKRSVPCSLFIFTH
jgi:hypothetical protein